MSASDACESDLLKLLFQNISWANVGNAGGLLQSTVAGSFFVSLHTADPGEAGTQTTNETSYTGYARVAVDAVGHFAYAGRERRGGHVRRMHRGSGHGDPLRDWTRHFGHRGDHL